MNNRHPSESDLALLAGADCGWLQSLRLNRHVARCGDCRDTLASFSELRSAVRDAAPSGIVSNEVDWNRMAGEIRANIHLGLAAGECVAELRPDTPRWNWVPRLAAWNGWRRVTRGCGVVPARSSCLTRICRALFMPRWWNRPVRESSYGRILVV